MLENITKYVRQKKIPSAKLKRSQKWSIEREKLETVEKRLLFLEFSIIFRRIELWKICVPYQKYA